MGAIQSFGSLLPALTGTLGTVQTIAGTLGAIKGLSNPSASENLAMEQLKAQQNLQEQQLAQNAALERESIALKAGLSEQERQSALRRAVARQRAAFGPSGISANAGGSTEAVLLGFTQESDTEREKREKLDGLRKASINLDLQQERSLNLLQATQLAEKQSLNRLF